MKIDLSIRNKIFLLFSFVILIAVFIIGYLGFKSASDAYINSALDLNKNITFSKTIEMEERVHSVPTDVLFTANSYSLNKYLVWKSIGDEQKMKQWLEAFSYITRDLMERKKIYAQIRIMSLNGDEVLNYKYDKFTGKVFATPKNKLQNKKHRDYFKNSLKLDVGEFYISPMNLNKEHKKIEIPYKPVVRYSTPIVNTNGEKLGVVIFNLYADEILSLISNLYNDKNNNRDYFLLNKKGYYLYHKINKKRWGFQLSSNESFMRDFPGSFEKIKEGNKDSGTFIFEGNIFSFKKVHPIDNIAQGEYWYLVSNITEQEALEDLNLFKTIFFLIILFIILFVFFVASWYTKKIISPLSEVSNKLKALSKGEIKDDIIEYNSKDEIGDIVESADSLIKAIDNTIKQANAVADGNFSKEIVLLSDKDELGFAIINMTKRLQEIELLAQKLSLGNYDIDVEKKGNDDKLGEALISMISYLKNITYIAESISNGEINVKYMIKSENDRLGYAVLDMMKYLKTILNQADAISKENYSVTVDPKSKNDELGNALLSMTEKLKQNYKKNRQEIWFSEGIGEFNDRLSGIDDTLNVSKRALSTICQYIRASSGVLYIYDKDEEVLNLSATYAFTCRTVSPSRVKLQEGIIGQVAFDKKPLHMDNVQDYEYVIQSGTTVSKPKEIFVIPLVFEDEILGVIELMTFNTFDKLKKDYLLRSSNILSTIIHSTNQNEKIKDLLSSSQEAYEELQVKSEELEAQSEELRVANEQMEEQSNILEMQKASLEIKNVEIENAKKQIDQRANELEQSNKYKSEFMANMSHELRTPLNSVILLSSLLSKNSKGNLNESDIQKAKVINESGSELLRLINDILDLSKIESGKMELLVDQISSDDLAKSFNEIFSHTASDKGISFNVVDKFEGIFYNDRDRLGQILRNLLSNAFKFTSHGSINLNIENSNDDELPVKISVSDTGVGIPEDKQELIFKAFTQADGSTSRQFGGTGLGLSISKELAHLMKGKIELYSKDGLGSTFTLHLPNLNDEYNENDRHHHIEMKEEKESIINKKEDLEANKEQFLIIEDDINYANTLKDIIEQNGSAAFVANNGKDGLELAKKHQFAGALIDLGLPDMNGIEVIKELKENSLTKNIHIQVISGMDKEKLEGQNVTIDGYLQKPVTNDQIVKAIENIEYLYNKEPKSVLIVDDDKTHLRAVKSYLEEENHLNSTMATTIKEAKKYIDEKYFDIAIVDLGLEDGSGEEVCKYIKSKREDTNILIYTGKDLSFQEADFLHEISDEIIIKNPNSHERLKDEVERFINGPFTTVNEKIEQYVKNHSDEEDFDVSILNDKKVLIVDDDMKNIFVLSSALGEHDMDISYAKNGKEALEFLDENEVDIVLMDIMMPVMNGYEAMEAIRKDEKIKHLPIIAVTAKAMDKDKEKAISAGADDYLTKPVDLEKLTKMISMWLNKH